MHLFGYHLRLAYRSLRRDLKFSLAMVFCLALAAAIWGGAVAHYLRLHEWHPEWPLTTHSIEATRAGAEPGGPVLLPGDWRRQALKLTWQEHTQLTQRLSSRVSGNYRASFLLHTSTGELIATRLPGRFANARLFDMFPRSFRWGGPWSSADEHDHKPVVVLSRALNRRVFDGHNSVGKQIYIEGQPFEVAGVLAEHQPFLPPWDLASTGADQENLYVPLTWALALKVRPEYAAPLVPQGRSFEDFINSRTPFVSTWVDVAPSQRAQVEAAIQATLSTTDARFRIRPWQAHRFDYPMPPEAASFFTVLCALVLLLGGFSVARLLFAKTGARKRETGVHRALGASRSSLFLRTMMEAAMVSCAAALFTLPLLKLLLWFFNIRHLTNDIPLALTPSLALTSTLPVLAVGLLAGVYPAWKVARTPPTLYLSRV